MRIRRSLPSTGWYAVLALAVVAALGASTVVGAGLSLWRGSAEQRAVGVPPEPLLRPGSGIVTVPAHPAQPRTRRLRPVPPAVAPPPAAPRSTRAVAVRHHQQPLPSQPTSHSHSLPAAHSPAVVKRAPTQSPAVGITVGPTGTSVPTHVVAPAPRAPVSGVFFTHPSWLKVHLLLTALPAVPAATPALEPPDEQPEHPDHPAHPDHPGHPDHPEHPDHPAHPEHPEHPAQPGHDADHGDDD